MGRRKKAPATPTAGLSGKSLSQVAAEAKALGLTYGQYTVLVETDTLRLWLRNNGKGRKDEEMNTPC